MNLQHTSKDPFWIDEAGTSVPFNRTTPIERKKEKYAASLVKAAKKGQQLLTEIKAAIVQATEEILTMEREAHNVKLDGKGGFTWYNFDRSIKIQADVSEQIKFDDIKIEAAKEKLLSLIRENVQADDFIISIVEDAFQTSRGKLDAKKILSLKKHTSRIKNAQIKKVWDEAMNLIDQSISRPKSKSYYKVWLKNEAGEYEGIELNFSAL